MRNEGMGREGGVLAARGFHHRLLGVEGLLLRAALLSGYGSQARPFARRLAAITEAGEARSCLDAGTPLQLTVDAPGPAGLRVGIRIGNRLTEAPMIDLVPAPQRHHLLAILRSLPPDSHPSLGAWLLWTKTRQSILVDLRDPEPRDALARLHAILDETQLERLRRVSPDPTLARPWALRVEADEEGLHRLHLHWLVARHASAPAVAESLAPGAWPEARELLGRLLRSPERSGRFVVVTPLDDRSPRALRLISTGWTLVPEDENKHRAIGTLFSALGGAGDHAEALWSLCRGGAGPRWRVGRAVEVRVSELGPRVRLYFTPQVDTNC